MLQINTTGSNTWAPLELTWCGLEFKLNVSQVFEYELCPVASKHIVFHISSPIGPLELSMSDFESQFKLDFTVNRAKEH